MFMHCNLWILVEKERNNGMSMYQKSKNMGKLEPIELGGKGNE